MKPGKPLQRHTELARGAGPKRRTPLRPSPGAAVPLRARSPMRAAVGYRQQQAATRAAVFARDGGQCLLMRTRFLETDGQPAGSRLGTCHGNPLTPHHLRKAGQGGPYSLRNLITLCAGHNDRIEELPRADMVAAGLVVPRGADIGSAWALLQLQEIVAWWWDGTPAHRPRPDVLHRLLP